MKFSEKIIELRKQKGLSQEELGYKINVSRQTISKWEAEQSSPEVEKVKELSKVFDVSIEYLLNDELENPKQVSKKLSKKIIKKIFVILLLSIVAFYLIISLFKFGVLLYCSIKANKIPDYNNYSAMHRIMSNDGINIREYSSTETNCNDIIKINHVLPEAEITLYTNLKEHKSYIVRYERETDTYYYKNLLKGDNYDETSSEEGQQNIIEYAQSHINNNLRDIILDSLNPKVKVLFEDDCIKIERKEKDLNSMVVISRETGMVLSILEFNDSKYENYFHNEYFDYTLDNNLPEIIENDLPELIEEPNLENINYIVE